MDMFSRCRKQYTQFPTDVSIKQAIAQHVKSVVATYMFSVFVNKKGTSRQLSGNGAIRKILSLHKSRGWKKIKMTLRYVYQENTS